MDINEATKLILTELDHFQTNFQVEGGALTYDSQASLKEEPLIGYAVASDRNEAKTVILLCRHAVPYSLDPCSTGATYASYLSPLGRIITRIPGETHTFAIKHRTGLVIDDHLYTLLEKDEFRSRRTDEGFFDAEDNRFSWTAGSALARSLRALIRGLASPGPAARHRQIRVQLPDLAILDAAQDDLFRLPFNHRLRISGAPGTGKTTVLLKRLSQKTKYEHLTEDEQRLATQAEWNSGKSWLLFTPSDLLKSYLKEALNKELLPADDEHVKVYSTFRNTILRETRFQGGTHGYFRVAPGTVNLLKRDTGKEHVQLTKAFGQFFSDRVSEMWRRAIQEFNNATRPLLGKVSEISQQVSLKGAEMLSAAGTDIVELRRAQARFSRLMGELNPRLINLQQQIRKIGALQDTELTASLQFLYRQHEDLLALHSSVNSDNPEPGLFPDLPALIASVRHEIRSLADSISVRRLFDSIPRAYQDFREARDNRERYFSEDDPAAVRERLLSPPEQDTLLFHALEFLRAVRGEFGSDLSGVPDGLRSLMGWTRLLIAVDEVTDFSAVQIACMERFARQRRGGVTICGDILQRITAHGLKRWEELEELSSGFAGRELAVSYRQTARLFAIARDLFAHVTETAPNFRSAHESSTDDPEPLWYRPTEGNPATKWLAERIVEICDLCSGRLPTTAILVPTKNEVHAVCTDLRELLGPHGIEVQASEDGQALGDGERVRIFPIEFIKGLEFEVAFYVGLDQMAAVHKELVDKYFYVGLSRARSFLGVTCERSPKQLPKTLQLVHQHFSDRVSFSDATIEDTAENGDQVS